MRSNKGFLITRPRHEILLNLLFHWSKLVIDEAQAKQFRIFDLEGDKANRKTFVSYIMKNKPSLVFFNGHGSDDVITGHNNAVLIETNNGTELLKGAVVYARSCNAAKGLGAKAIKKGCRAFIGYRHKFVVAHSTVDISRPFEDELAKLFIEPSNLVPISLLKGNSAGEAYKKSQRAMRRNFSFMQSSAATWEQQSLASYLWGNIRAQVVLGNQEATA